MHGIIDPHTRGYDPTGGIDIKIDVFLGIFSFQEKELGDEILRLKNQLNAILAKNTGQTLKKIETDTDRDNFLTSKDAKKYGIIDSILTKRK